MAQWPATVAAQRASNRHAGGRLYLSDVDARVQRQFERSGMLAVVAVDGPVQVYPTTPNLGESSQAARAAGESWLVTRQADAPAASPLPSDAVDSVPHGSSRST